LVIGNEILRAQVTDTNSNFICKHLYRCGVKVKKISVISDDVDEIAQEIKEFSGKYTHVITSGGIGPTHDDVTFQGLAKAFDDNLYCHPTLVKIIKTYFHIENPLSPIFKPAYIPKQAILKFTINSDTNLPSNFPCIILKNVYVFPGSPAFLQVNFKNLYKILFDTKKRFIQQELFLNASEDVFANALSTASKEFPNIVFGSYPEEAKNYKVRVTIEGDEKTEIKKARERFCNLIPSNIVVDYTK
ncbi:PREDICTED: FAD synthase-like, partial [Ceratosolen solmsi marchali]|uniref:FAD synthase-like n=1 Tax=Ceratosolen solmsi marchali TaxID=326594 RepID=A0AAJ6YFM7_9HYME